MAERREVGAARNVILGGGAANLSTAFTTAFPVAGAAVSVLAGPASGSTVSATDAAAGRLDEIQFDLGEGPCWTALSRRAPVMHEDLRDRTEWPAFTEAVLDDALTHHVTAMYAFPLAVGTLDIGAIDMYSTEPGLLEPRMLAEASALAGLTTWQVLRKILDDHAGEYDSNSLGYARREVHQATGMIIVQLDLSPEDAELLLRAHAFSSGRSVAEIANDVVERRLAFDSTGGR